MQRSKVVNFKNSCQFPETFDKFHIIIRLQQELFGTAFFFMITIGNPSSSSFIGLRCSSIPSLIFLTLKQASTLFKSFNINDTLAIYSSFSRLVFESTKTLQCTFYKGKCYYM